MRAYSIKCPHNSEKDCKPQPVAEYRLDYANREGVLLFHGQLEKLVDCTFWDDETWKCSYSDGLGSVEFRDGVKQRGTRSVPDIRYVPGWRWRVYTLIELIKSSPIG